MSNYYAVGSVKVLGDNDEQDTGVPLRRQDCRHKETGFVLQCWNNYSRAKHTELEEQK